MQTNIIVEVGNPDDHVLRIAYLRIAHQVANPELGKREGDQHQVMMKLSVVIINRRITLLSKFDADHDDQDGPYAADWPRFCLHSLGLLRLLHFLQVKRFNHSH